MHKINDKKTDKIYFKIERKVKEYGTPIGLQKVGYNEAGTIHEMKKKTNFICKINDYFNC